ncbi:MAG: double-strand break repair protein AddB [Pseudomonadota bacterium]|nr:double-strand break repair protein AddB [Pseudomonadota bacterium]
MFRRSPEQKSIFTISPNSPFVDTLAQAVFDHSDAEMISLFDYTILLPTRRAVRSLKEAFLRVTDKEALLLPKMIPLGDLDEDELEIGGIEDTNFFNDGQIPDAISNIHRQLLLAQLVQVLKSVSMPFDQSVQLAGELGRLLDQVQTEQLSFENLNLLVPETLSEHWQMTLQFLKIITDQWPRILKELNLIDPADRRNRLLAAQCRFWEQIPPRGPVIAAGSTGSIPATAKLLDFVASLPNGCVVLPGLDQSLNQIETLALLPTHPQYGMHQLLSAMEVTADKVLDLYIPPNNAKNRGHSELINLALRPEASDQDKKQIRTLLDRKFEGIEYVECSTPDEESSVIALMMRKITEEKDKTAALITPDRDLARRVTSQLKRWGIRVNDSAGQLLENCPPGIFLRLTSKLITDNFRPIDLLALCKHPIAACGFSPKKLRNLIRRLEITALRGPRPGPGLRGIISLLREPEDELRQLLNRIEEYSNEFTALVKGESAPLEKILEAHVRFAEAFAASDEQTGRERLWSGEFGEAVFEFVFELLNKAQMMGSFSCREYSGFLKIMMSGHMVRPNYRTHPRLQIWGLLEARLQKADLLILGGLNEGTWPPEPRADPWMSRSMRSKFGLSPYERRIGLTAHDFTQAFSAPRVALTRYQTV